MALSTTNNVEFPDGDGRTFESYKKPGLLLARPGTGTVVLQVATFNGAGVPTWTAHKTYSENADEMVEIAHGKFRVVLTGNAAYEFRV